MAALNCLHKVLSLLYIMNELTFACVLIVDDIILWIAKEVSESRGCSVLTSVHRSYVPEPWITTRSL